MIENFEHLYLLILHILMTALFGIYTFRALFKPEGMVKEFNMDQSSVYIVRVLGTFVAPFFLIGIYLIFRPNGPEGAWVYYNIIIINFGILSVYVAAVFLKKVDNDKGTKNSVTDLAVNTFTLISSIILILGLSNKIYI